MPGLETYPRRERLTKRADYLDIYRQGERMVGRGFICYVVRQEGRGRKFGLAVSRRVGGAVVRNRVKRYIRETYRTSRKGLRDDFRVVIVARPSASDMTFAECSAAIGQLFRKGGVVSE